MHYLGSVFLIAATWLSVCVSESRHFNWDKIKYVYAFGDSYTYVDGTAGHPAFSFIGDMLNYSFTPEQLLADTIIANSTSAGGPNWPEYLTGCFSGPPSACQKQLWNFAFAGADIDGDILPLHHDYTIPLVDQVRQWATYAAHVIPHPRRETLTLWWIGINDTGDTVNNVTITDFAAFWELEIQSYFKAVKLANDRGLTQHLFLNVPPGERSPNSLKNATRAAIQKRNIELYNSALDNHVNKFAAENPRSNVMAFDAHAWFNQVLDSPAANGFTNITGSCSCSDPGYFWWNAGHPTASVHQLLAKAVLKVLQA